MTQTKQKAPASENIAHPAAPEQLFALLEGEGIEYELCHHEPVFTVAESSKIEKDIDGIHCRNLFLRDKKKKMFLVVAANETQIDLKKLQKLIGSDRLSFGSAERLWDHLGVRPGSVCPYAILNDKDHKVDVILDAYMMNGERINHHPLQNDMTIGVRPDDLMRFFKVIGREAKILDLGAAAPDP